MFGHKWEQAQGTVIEVHGPGAGAPLAADRQYTVELGSPDGRLIRVTVSEHGTIEYPVGSPVHLEVNFKSGEARIDATAMSDFRVQLEQDRQHFASAGPQAGWTGEPGGFGGAANLDLLRQMGVLGGPGAVTAGGGTGNLGGLISALAAAAAAGGATEYVHVMDQTGQEVRELPPGSPSHEDLHNAAQAILSGDPDARRAAIAKLRQLQIQLNNPGTNPQPPAS